jgi:C-terminal processing protease CtpA/Prc
MHAVDPVQRLRLLRYRQSTLSEQQFHAELLGIFTQLRDLHTIYLLPEPFNKHTAFLPFRIEEYFEGDARRYVVTQTRPGFTHPHFGPGTVITHWNGVPIARAVELNAERHGGSNQEARRARGVATMTIRPLAWTAPPDEEWVVVGHTAGGRTREIRVDWEVFQHEPPPGFIDPNSILEPLSRVLAVDTLTETVRRAAKALFSPEAIQEERRAERLRRRGARSSAARRRLTQQSTMPDVVQFRPVHTRHGDFGYLRIRTFGVPDPDGFVAEVVRILGFLPPNGLIIDVRGNGGGVVMAAERLLQLFTPRRIEPERLHFINTALTLELCTRVPELAAWRPSIAQAVEIGAPFSDGFPILPGEEVACNHLGQQYHGPVVLITDAFCFSATDIFAAGFQDHSIGPILGTSANTGAGGANVWTHELIRQLLAADQSPFRPLPRGTAFQVAVRRTTRVGERLGDPVEDLGIVPDEIHRLTQEDLLRGNVDLIEHAARLLAPLPVRVLRATLQPPGGVGVTLSVTTENLSRLDAYVNARPQVSLDVGDGTIALNLPVGGAGPHAVELRGFADDQLVASRRITVS